MFILPQPETESLYSGHVYVQMFDVVILFTFVYKVPLILHMQNTKIQLVGRSSSMTSSSLQLSNQKISNGERLCSENLVFSQAYLLRNYVLWI